MNFEEITAATQPFSKLEKSQAFPTVLFMLSILEN